MLTSITNTVHFRFYRRWYSFRVGSAIQLVSTKEFAIIKAIFIHRFHKHSNHRLFILFISIQPTGTYDPVMPLPLYKVTPGSTRIVGLLEVVAAKPWMVNMKLDLAISNNNDMYIYNEWILHYM